MGNLKYNPLLKLNLEEETDAEEVLGDGYNEKLLGWEDFLTDCQTITYDTGEIRKYSDSNWARTIPANTNINFSFIFYCGSNTSGNIIVANNVNFKGKFSKFVRAHLDGIYNIYSENFILSNCQIRSRTTFVTNEICNIFFNNISIYNFYSSVFKITANKTTSLFIFNSTNFNYDLVNKDKFRIISDGSINISTNQDLISKYLTVDNELNENSRGLLPNSVITAALQALQPDASLDADSNKPVMNSAVTNKINTITQIIENFQDINVSNLTEFENAIQTGQNANVRIHLTTDITLTQSVTYNLDKIQIYGHDNKINLQNFTFTIQGESAFFNAVRFNANSSVNATTAANYSNAQINIISAVNSARFFFEYVIFMNFVCKSSDNSATDYVRTFIDVKNGSGLTYPSLHLYLTFCEIMTNYTQSNINNLCAAVNHSGSLHALTVHNIDFWGNNIEANSCGNWTFTGNSLSGLAKLGWFSDGSATYAQRTNSLTPSFVNQYNPSKQEFTQQTTVINNINNFVKTTVTNTDTFSDNSGSFTATATIYKNSFMCFVKLELTTTSNSTQPITDTILNIGFNVMEKAFISCINPSNNSTFALTLYQNGDIAFRYGSPSIPTATELTFSALLA